MSGNANRPAAAGQVRYFLVDGPGIGPRRGVGPQPIMAVAHQDCLPVEDLALPARYRGRLFDYAGKADAFLLGEANLKVR